jgi:hypothetical protein
LALFAVLCEKWFQQQAVNQVHIVINEIMCRVETRPFCFPIKCRREIIRIMELLQVHEQELWITAH